MAIAPQPAHFDRRRLLGIGLGLGSLGVVAATGCTVTSPTVNTAGQTAKPPVTPTPPPPMSGAASGATVETELSELAAQILTGADDSDLGKSLRTVLTAARDAHAAHAVALRGAEPTSRPSTPAAPSGRKSGRPVSSVATAVKTLAAAEASAAADHAKAAAAATGFSCLLWASLQACCNQFEDALLAGRSPARTPKPSAHRAAVAVSDLEAIRALLGQEHAIIYGYQLAIGEFTLSSDHRSRADARLTAHRRLRDQLTALLVRRGAAAPVAEPAYQPPFHPDDPDTSAELLMIMERALLPFCGQWVAAAADKSGQDAARTALTRTTLAASGWDGPMLTWPGWPS